MHMHIYVDTKRNATEWQQLMLINSVPGETQRSRTTNLDNACYWCMHILRLLTEWVGALPAVGTTLWERCRGCACTDACSQEQSHLLPAPETGCWHHQCSWLTGECKQLFSAVFLTLCMWNDHSFRQLTRLTSLGGRTGFQARIGRSATTNSPRHICHIHGACT